MAESSEVTELTPVPYIYRFSWAELIRTAFIGACVGALVPLLSSFLGRYVIEPLACRNQSNFGFCAEGDSVAFGVALTVLSTIALLVLASYRAYQPLLNVVAPLAALWGIDRYLQLVASDHRFEYYLFSTALFMLAYVMFYLLLRFRRFAISIVLVGLTLVLMRMELLS